ncbi:unnamed protein product [Porites lobata]|uniref:G-protein coupled receptors family 1 profile domain-containing protein n=1 Tax=Porites lobata TaxID=104759 RepID=A0ABN8QSM8_9CNID|nr:unnamed protein product [Porites lobata]
MAEFTNITGEKNEKTIAELYCSTEEVHNEVTFLSATNIFLSMTAFVENSLVLVALHKTRSLHPPSKLLFLNLAITDLCVGIIVEPLYVSYLMSVVNERWDICYYALLSSFITGYVMCSVSLLTLTTTSMDRLLALLLGLSTSSYFWDIRILVLWGKISVPLCLVVSGISYTKIFVTLRHNHIQVQDRSFQGQLQQTTLLNKARYRKAVSNALWVQLVLAFCYFPYIIAQAVTPQRGIPLSGFLAREFTKTLIFLNSSLNPLIYFWKMRELRQAVKNTLCCLSGFIRSVTSQGKTVRHTSAEKNASF